MLLASLREMLNICFAGGKRLITLHLVIVISTIISTIIILITINIIVMLVIVRSNTRLGDLFFSGSLSVFHDLFPWLSFWAV